MRSQSILTRGGLLMAAVTLSLSLTARPVRCAEVYHWDFTQSATDLVNGVAATLANPGGLGAQGYTFNSTGQGVSVTQPADKAVTDTYTIFVVFSLTANDRSYQRIIDFKNKASDFGVYARNNNFWFYDMTPNVVSPIFEPDQTVVLAIRRNGATNLVSGVVNGQLAWSFTDVDSDGAFSAANNLMRFFEDDFGTNEHPAGTVRKIRVFNTALPTEAEINQQIASVNKSIKKAAKIKDKRKRNTTLRKFRKKLPGLWAQLAYIQSLSN